MGVEPDSGGRARESLDQESVEREDVQQESAKAAGSQLAGARLPLEAGSVVPGEDGHIQSAPANRPLAFRFAACGVQFEAEIAGRTAPLTMRANLRKLPYSAEFPPARSPARVGPGASGRLRRGRHVRTTCRGMMGAGGSDTATTPTPAR